MISACSSRTARLRGVDASGIFHTSIGAVMRPDHPLAARRSLTFTDCAAYPVVMLYDRWLLDLIMATEFAESGEKLVPRLVSNSIDFMRQIIERGLGIGFFTPIGFIDEIERGELVHVALAEPLLADSAIAILVPRGREPTLPARIAMDAIRRDLAEFAKRLPAQASGSARRAAKGSDGSEVKSELRGGVIFRGSEYRKRRQFSRQNHRSGPLRLRSSTVCGSRAYSRALTKIYPITDQDWLAVGRERI